MNDVREVSLKPTTPSKVFLKFKMFQIKTKFKKCQDYFVFALLEITYCYYCYHHHYVCACSCHSAVGRTSEDNFRELVLFFHHGLGGIKLKSSAAHDLCFPS